jgi:tetratricopeptide (TPR) repeat protein
MPVSDSYEHIYARAERSLAEGKYDVALDDYRRLSQRLSGLKPAVLDRRPALRDLHHLSLARQAELCHIRGEYEQAIQLFEQLIDIAPGSGDNWRRAVALVRIDMGQVEAGLDELRAQAVAHPGDTQLWLTIGLESEAQGQFDEAEESLGRAARSATDPDDKAEAFMALFDFYRARGQVEEALSAWDQAWQAQGRSPDYIFPLYQMMQESGDLEQSRQYLKREKNPLRRGFFEGVLATIDGTLDEADKHWKRVANMDPLKFEEGQEAWAEAALRVDWPPEKIVGVLNTIFESASFSLRELVLQAVAEARLGHGDHVVHVLEMARNLFMRSRPRQDKLSLAHWALFDELVSDDEIKHNVRDYFAEEVEGEVD